MTGSCSLDNVESIEKLIDDYQLEGPILATGKHVPFHFFFPKACKAVRFS